MPYAGWDGAPGAQTTSDGCQYGYDPLGNRTYEGTYANNLQIYLSDSDTEFTSLNPEALAAFGAALHAIEDSLSPAHAGFKVWDYDPLHILHHHNAESHISPQQMQNAVNAARGAFNNTFSFFDFQAAPDNPTVTTSQHDNLPCGGAGDPPCK